MWISSEGVLIYWALCQQCRTTPCLLILFPSAIRQWLHTTASLPSAIRQWLHSTASLPVGVDRRVNTILLADCICMLFIAFLLCWSSFLWIPLLACVVFSLLIEKMWSFAGSGWLSGDQVISMVYICIQNSRFFVWFYIV